MNTDNEIHKLTRKLHRRAGEFVTTLIRFELEVDEMRKESEKIREKSSPTFAAGGGSRESLEAIDEMLKSLAKSLDRTEVGAGATVIRMEMNMEDGDYDSLGRCRVKGIREYSDMKQINGEDGAEDFVLSVRVDVPPEASIDQAEEKFTRLLHTSKVGDLYVDWADSLKEASESGVDGDSELDSYKGTALRTIEGEVDSGGSLTGREEVEKTLNDVSTDWGENVVATVGDLSLDEKVERIHAGLRETGRRLRNEHIEKYGQQAVDVAGDRIAKSLSTTEILDVLAKSIEERG